MSKKEKDVNVPIKNKNVSNVNVPKLRFPEFKNEKLTKNKISNIANMYTGGTPNANNYSFYNGNIPFIKSGDIYEEKARYFISVEGFNSSNAKMVNKGDILFALYGATSGNVSIAKFKGAINQAVLAINCHNYSNKFLMYLLESNKNKIIKKYLQGGQGNLSAKIIKKLPLYFPNKEEQNKIVSFLSLIDEKIETQNKIINCLEKQNKYIKDKLFDNESKCNLFKFSDFLESSKKNADKIDKQKLMTVKLHNKGISKSSNIKTLKIGKTEYFKRSKGQFIYGKQNFHNGALGIIPKEFDGFLTSNDVPAFNFINDICDNKYFLYYVSRKNYYKKIGKFMTGTGSKRLQEKEFLNLNICLPSLEKQKSITKILDKLETKINLEINQLNALNNMKIYFLNNMFVK